MGKFHTPFVNGLPMAMGRLLAIGRFCLFSCGPAPHSDFRVAGLHTVGRLAIGQFNTPRVRWATVHPASPRKSSVLLCTQRRRGNRAFWGKNAEHHLCILSCQTHPCRAHHPPAGSAQAQVTPAPQRGYLHFPPPPHLRNRNTTYSFPRHSQLSAPQSCEIKYLSPLLLPSPLTT
jgi:hypothetical protein